MTLLVAHSSETIALHHVSVHRQRSYGLNHVPKSVMTGGAYVHLTEVCRRLVKPNKPMKYLYIR